MFYGAELAAACSCANTPPRTLLRSADAAFVGRLVKVRTVDATNGTANFYYRVQHVYKGKRRLSRRRVVVRSNLSGASCGLPRGKGRRYGVFLNRSKGRWHSNLCLVVTPSEMRGAQQVNAASRLCVL